MTLTDTRTGDTCRIIRHRSGLEIRVTELPDFRTASAQLVTKFGAQHIRFRLSPDADVTEMPPGIAHYLEHKLFENPDCSASELFASLGAHDNAYTDYDRTVYFFQTAREFPEALRVLLDFVTHPFFTAENVERERGIIMQELQEALDDPADVLEMQLFSGMFHTHPVREHVLGTVQSIRQITPALLLTCWQTFYNLSNMALCCAGNITAEQVVQIADAVLPETAPPMRAVPVLLPEPGQVRKRRMQCSMDVGRTQFMIGFKSAPAAGMERLRDSLLCLLVIELIAGDSAPLYLELLDSGLLHDTFATDCLAGDGWFAVTAEGESEDPDAVCAALCKEIRRVKTEGLDVQRFADCKKAAYGDALIGLNSPEAAADAMTDAFVSGHASPFARAELLAELTLSDAQDCLMRRFDPECLTLSVITPEPNLNKNKGDL